MKKLLFVVIISITGAFLCSFIEQGEKQQCCFPKEHFTDQNWYKPFLSLLTQENKIDSADARVIKATSSNVDRINESIQQTIKRYGKLEEADIKLMCNLKENDDSKVYVFTHAIVYIDLFTILKLIA